MERTDEIVEIKLWLSTIDGLADHFKMEDEETLEGMLRRVSGLPEKAGAASLRTRRRKGGRRPLEQMKVVNEAVLGMLLDRDNEYTQVQIARACGVSQAHVSKVVCLIREHGSMPVPQREQAIIERRRRNEQAARARQLAEIGETEQTPEQMRAFELAAMEQAKEAAKDWKVYPTAEGGHGDSPDPTEGGLQE